MELKSFEAPAKGDGKGVASVPKRSIYVNGIHVIFRMNKTIRCRHTAVLLEKRFIFAVSFALAIARRGWRGDGDVEMAMMVAARIVLQ